MIIGKDFSLGHIPRTAGTKTAIILNQLVGILNIESMVHTSNHWKHFSFSKFDLKNNLFLNFRRLIPWMRSMINFYQLGIWPDRKPIPITDKSQAIDLSLNWGVEYNKEFNVPLAVLPDTYIKYFTDDGALIIKDWIRCEFLEEDLFSKIVIPYYNKDFCQKIGLSEKAIEKLLYKFCSLNYFDKRIVTCGLGEYDRDLYAYFTKEDMIQIYANNPLWASVEKQQYGNLFYEMDTK